MKVIAKQNRELLMINAQNTQNENDAEKIFLQLPEKYEDFVKKIVFITPDGVVWDLIENNEYLIKRAITKYEQVKFYIWLTKDDVDFRTEEKPLKFNKNHKVEGEVTPEEESDIERIISILDEEIIKVENLDLDVNKIGDTTTVTITKKDGTEKEVEILDGQDGQDGQDGYTPVKGVDYFTEQDIEDFISIVEDDGFIKNDTDDLLNYELKINTGSSIALSINPSTYVMTMELKNSANTTISSDTVDLPLETMVVNGSYNTQTKKIVLTLQNGNTIEFSVEDLIDGLQSEITINNKLDSGLVDDSNSNNKFVTPTEKTTWSDKYNKPSGGIPKSDLSSEVQTSLGKADTALQEHQSLTDYVKNTDYATGTTGGVIKAGNGFTVLNSGYLSPTIYTYTDYITKANALFISKGTLENVITGKDLTTNAYVDNIVGDIESILHQYNTGSGV